jgi:hypothetical protein
VSKQAFVFLVSLAFAAVCQALPTLRSRIVHICSMKELSRYLKSPPRSRPKPSASVPTPTVASPCRALAGRRPTSYRSGVAWLVDASSGLLRARTCSSSTSNRAVLRTPITSSFCAPRTARAHTSLRGVPCRRASRTTRTQFALCEQTICTMHRSPLGDLSNGSRASAPVHHPPLASIATPLA